MSGGNCPETPRQKMIGMMYLMLTAMLALNVSGDLLNAFILVDKSIKSSCKTVEEKNKILYYNFEQANAQNPKRVNDKYQAALQVKAHADSLYNKIYGYKKLMILKADGPEFTPDSFLSTSNQDIAAQVMMVESGGDRSKDLKKSIEEYRDFLISVVEGDEGMKRNVESMLSTQDPPNLDGTKPTWESQQFEHLPLAATMGLMSNMQANVRNTEADVVTFLYKKIDEASFKFNAIKALAIPESNYVLRGGQYKADIMLAAYDDTMEPIVTIGDNKLPVEAGCGKYVVAASAVGSKKYTARIEIPDPITGELRPYTVDAEYEVGEPSVVVSPTKMNVAYIGVDNPMAISAAGISSSDLKVTATGGSITKSKDGYIAKPTKGAKELIISVSADINGKHQNLGSTKFRVKTVPDPKPSLYKDRETRGGIAVSEWKGMQGLFGFMKDFDFDLPVKVTSFTLSTMQGGFTVSEKSNGAAFSSAQKSLISKATQGKKYYIENIDVSVAGETRHLTESLIVTLR